RLAREGQPRGLGDGVRRGDLGRDPDEYLGRARVAAEAAEENAARLDVARIPRARDGLVEHAPRGEDGYPVGRRAGPGRYRPFPERRERRPGHRQRLDDVLDGEIVARWTIDRRNREGAHAPAKRVARLQHAPLDESRRRPLREAADVAF